MRAFVESGRQDQFGAAAHVLNLNQIDQAQRPEKAKVITRQLYQVIDRRVWVDCSELPSRPNAKLEQTTGNSNTPGEVRRDHPLSHQIKGRVIATSFASICAISHNLLKSLISSLPLRHTAMPSARNFLSILLVCTSDRPSASAKSCCL